MITTNIYQTVKEAVTTRQAAEYYGLTVGHNGLTRCLFHEDRTPSMKVDKRFYCFGCGATGDVIDFMAQLFHVGPYDAARKLAADFHLDGPAPPASTRLPVSDPNRSPASAEPIWRRKKETTDMELSLPGGSGMKLASSDATRQQEREYLDTLIEYERHLEEWKETYAPTLQASTWDDRFVEACRMLAPVIYYIDQLCFAMLMSGRRRWKH